MYYAVAIKETLKRTVIIEGKSFEDAKDKIEDLYLNSEIILDADDFSDKEFCASETFGENPISPDDKRLDVFSKVGDLVE